MAEDNNKYSTKDDDALMQQVTNNPGFHTLPKVENIIKVIGVGGGGNNAISHMYEQDIKGVSFVIINTDKQALDNSPVPNRLLIGPETTCGLGAGNDPARAEQAAQESREEIAKLFDPQTKMVFITAGMGGGTGTGAAPVVAHIAKEAGMLTIGIVTIPFLFEGRKKILKALDGADKMKKDVDALLIINNERLTEIYPDLDFINAFAKADETLSIAANSISELITTNGKINLDFNDVNTTLRDGGVAIISSGYGEGDRRVTHALANALESPLLKNRDVYSSQKVLINVYVNPTAQNSFKTEEINEIKEFMSNFYNDVDVIWGVAFDPDLGEKVKVTILAAGFDVSLNEEAPSPAKKAKASVKQAPKADENSAAAAERLAEVYGNDKIEEQEREKAKLKYFIFDPSNIDNDQIIELIEKTPTLNRDPKFRTEVRAIQDMAREVAAPTRELHQMPNAKASKPTNGSISFN